VALTVTATQGGTTTPGMDLMVLLYTGAQSPAAIATGGATGTKAFTSNGALQLAITPNATGSLIIGSMNNGVNTAYTALASTTLKANVSNASQTNQYGIAVSSATTTSGTPVTIGASAPTTAEGQIALAEILASGTLTEDTANEPANVSSTTLTALTTASFTPNPGDLVVVVVSASGGNGANTVSLSNTGGLTFTSLVAATTAFYGVNEVWVAQMPGGAAPPQQLQQRGGQTWRHQFRRPQQFSPPLPQTIDSTGSGLTGAGSLIAGGAVSVPGTAALDGVANLSAPATQGGAAAVDGAGSLITGAVQSTAAAVDGAGSLIAGGSVTLPGVAGIAGAGSLSAGGTQGAGAALDAAGALSAAGLSGVSAALVGTGTLATAGIQGAGAALDAAGTLAPSSTIAPAAALDAAGTLASAGTQGAPTALIGTGTLTSKVTLTPSEPLDAAGSLISGSTIAPAVALDSAGSVIAAATATIPGGAALDAAGALSSAATIAPAVALDAAGALATLSTIAPGAAIDAAGSLAAAGTISVAAALQGIGALAAASTAGQQGTAAVQGIGTLTANGSVLLNPVQIARNSVTTGTTCTVTLAATGAGNTLVAVAYSGATAISGVTLGGSADHWAVRSNVFNASVGVDAIWSDPVCAGGQTSVVVTQNASQAMAVIVYELPGNCVLDQVSAGNSSASGTTGWTSGTISATTQANEFWIGMVGGFNGAGTAASISTAPASPWNNQAILDFNTFAYLYTSWQYTTSTGTPAYTGTTNVTSANNSYGATIATFIPESVGAAPLVAAGSLIAGVIEQPGVTGLDAAGSLIAGVIEQPGPITLAAAGSILTRGTTSSPAPLIAAGSLSSVGYSVNAVLIGTGTLANSVIENSGAALDGTSSFVLGATETPGPVALTGTGTLSAIPGTSGGVALDAAGVLAEQVVQGQSAALVGTGSLIPKVIQAPGAAVDGAGTIVAFGFAIGAALAGQGSVIANARLGITTLIAGAGSVLTAAVQSPALEAFNFGTFPQIPLGSAITSVTVVVNDFASTSAMNPISFELWDGTSAKIGSTQIGTASTSPYNLDSATFTGVTYSQLATLRVRLYANAGSSVQGDQELASSVSLTVAFTPATNAAATAAVLKEATIFPAVTTVGQHNASAAPGDSIPVFTSFPAVTAGQLSIAAAPTILRCATVLPPVTTQGIVNASITVSTLALAGTVVASIVTASSTGPDYARSADIAAGTGTSVGTWTSVAGVTGPPDSSEAIWTRP
jgi:hypothetical protein